MSDWDESTTETSIMELILSEVQKLLTAHEKQQKELESLNERLHVLASGVEVVRAAQVQHGIELGRLEKQCNARYDGCELKRKKDA